jgi:hypothetical protein
MVEHLGDTAGVVADGAVAVDVEADGEGGEHAEGGPYLRVCEKVRVAAEAMGVARVSYWEASLNEMQTVTARARTGTDGRLHAEGETVDDVGGGASAARFSNFANGFVRVGGVVLGDEADEEAGPETASDASEDVAVVEGGGDGGDAVGAADGVVDGARGEEGLAHDVHNGGVEHGGDSELDLELHFNGGEAGHLAGACVLRLDDGHVHWDDGGQDANNMPCHFY